MSATYDDTLPTDRDWVRHELGDTDIAAPLRQDETYDALILALGKQGALRTVARALASEYARKPSSVSLPSGLSVSWSSRVSNWQAIADGKTVIAGALTGGGYASSTLTQGDTARVATREAMGLGGAPWA